MKHIFFSLFLLIGLTVMSFGQIGFSVSTGVNLSNVDFKNIPEISPEIQTNFFIGFSPYIKVTDKLRLNLDAQYSRKGYAIKESVDFESSDFRFSYFDIIPEIEYRLLKILTIGVGLNYAVLLNEQTRMDNEDWYSTEGIVLESDQGFSIKAKTELNKFYAFARLNFGLKDINNIDYTDQNGDVIDNVNQYNRNTQLGIGFYLGKKE